MNEQNEVAQATPVDVVTGAPQSDPPAEQVVASQDAQISVGGNSIAGAGLSAGSATPVSRAEWEAAHAAETRKNDRKQIAALVLANNLAPNTNLAAEADRAVLAAEALLDRLDR